MSSAGEKRFADIGDVMEVLLRFPKGKAKALTLSYDDGVRQDKRLVEILNRNGIKATFNINGGMFEKDDSNASTGRGRMSKEEAVACYANGDHEVAVHGYTHPFLEQLTPDAAAYEIVKDREVLEGLFGKIIKGMAYPYGTYNDEVVATLKSCGIAYARTTVSTEGFKLPEDWLRLPATCHHNNPRLMELAKVFAEGYTNYSAQLFYLWGHSYEFDNNNNWNVIEEFCEYIGNREDIWYATNIEIYNYVSAFNKLESSVDNSIIYNPTNTTIWFKLRDGKNYSIAPGETKNF